MLKCTSLLGYIWRDVSDSFGSYTLCVILLQVYSWGGNNFWWHEIQPDSMYQTKWRGDTTARSQLLLGTVGKQLPVDASVENDLNTMSPEDKKCEMIKEVSKYFNVRICR